MPARDARHQAAHLDVDFPAAVAPEGDDLGSVRACVTAGSTPVHSATSTAGPKRSTAWPLVRTRDSGIRSTTATDHP